MDKKHFQAKAACLEGLCYLGIRETTLMITQTRVYQGIMVCIYLYVFIRGIKTLQGHVRMCRGASEAAQPGRGHGGHTHRQGTSRALPSLALGPAEDVF